jgi:hypothetical protein
VPTTLPAASRVNPCGVFIQEFAVTTEKAPPMPAMSIGTPDQKWAHPLNRFQP